MQPKSFAVSLLKKQLSGNVPPSLLLYLNPFKDLNKNTQYAFSVGLSNDNLFEWDVCFEGPIGTLYEVKTFFSFKISRVVCL